MQKAPVMKGTGLVPVKESKEVHVFGKNLEDRIVTESEDQTPSTSLGPIVDDNKPADEDIEEIRKRKFDAITGEEDEETVFQGEFKLFVWDLATSNWIEKGGGQLKLNDSVDKDVKKSRLIMRLSGTLRIILNVAIKNSFFKVIACSKTNIRFTNSQTVWAASGANTSQLADLIDERLKISAAQDKIEVPKRARSDDEEDKDEEAEASPSSKKTKSDCEAPTSTSGAD